MKIRHMRYPFLIMVVVVIAGAMLLAAFPRVTVNASNKILSLSINRNAQASVIPPNWWLDENLQNGLWYQDINAPIYVQATPQAPIYQVSFMKIYSGFAGQPTLRVMELSTYPRAYVDKDPHVYQVDTPFVVGQDDLNDFYNSEYAQQGGYQYRPEIPDGENVYVDTKQLVFRLGETATHYAGDPLPGNFPMWIASETLPTPKWVDNKSTVFPAVFQAVKGQLVNYTMYEAYYRNSDTSTWTLMPSAIFNQFVAAFSGTDPSVKLNAKVGKDRLIVRVIYDRVFVP